MKPSTALRRMLGQDKTIIVPGVYDALSARLAEQAGFNVIFTTGFGLSASTLGLPDMGLMSASEMIDRVSKIAASVSIPVFADMDTGYGNALNVVRTVQECVRHGVAGVFLEDQEWPKKCGHFENKRVIPAEEHAGKIAAAVHARGDDDLVIVARTDARGVHGLEEAIRRSKLYKEAGADVVFIEAPQSVEEMREIGRVFAGTPLLANIIEGGKTPLLSAPELQELGFQIALYPLASLFVATQAMAELYRRLFAEQTTAGCQDAMVGFQEFKKIVGEPELRELEQRFAAV